MAVSITKKFSAVFKLIREPKVFYSLVSFRAFGYLLETGWLNSFKSGNPVDDNYKPIPWFTYSAIDFLKAKVNSTLSVLELGSGNSTLFFAERANKVISLEHNKDWYQKILKKAPDNVELIYTESKNAVEYLKPISTTSNKYDVIIIDALFRNECVNECLNCISEQGVIVFDDTERKDYEEGIAYAMKNGFRRLDFSGIAAGIFFRKCTSIFYRKNNCLGI